MEEVITRMETFGVMESKNPSVDCPYGYIVFIYRDGTRKVVPKDYFLDQRIRISAILDKNTSNIKPKKMKESTKVDPFLVLGVGFLVIALLAGIVLILM